MDKRIDKKIIILIGAVVVIIGICILYNFLFQIHPLSAKELQLELSRLGYSEVAETSTTYFRDKNETLSIKSLGKVKVPLGTAMGTLKNGWFFDFGDYDTERIANEFIPLLVDEFTKGSEQTSKTKKANWTRYEFTYSGDHYALMVTTSKNYLLVSGPIEDENEIKNLFTQLGYYK